MAFLSKIVVLVSFFTAIYAAPLSVPRAKVSAASSCASWGVIDSSPYELQSNLWGASGASGSQCTVSVVYLI
jgi:hypothetical protein